MNELNSGDMEAFWRSFSLLFSVLTRGYTLMRAREPAGNGRTSMILHVEIDDTSTYRGTSPDTLYRLR